MTKLKKIILSDRAARLEREEKAKNEREINEKETGEKEAEDDKEEAVMELEVTVEVGRVYVNLLVPEGDEGVVGVDLVYLEDEDDDEDEEDEAEAEAVPEPELEPEAKPEPEPEAKPEPKPAPELSHPCQSPSPRLRSPGACGQP